MTEIKQRQGTVIAAYRRYTLVKDENENIFQCQQRKSTGQVICGDNVSWQAENDGTGVITEIHKRHSILQRPDMNGNARSIAANIDQVFIVVSFKPELNEGLIDRYLVAAEHGHLKPIIVFNKTDLLGEQERAEIKQRLYLYQEIGYKVIFTSAVEAHGLDELLSLLKNNNNIFVGQSGVGKSSLINSLLKDSNARIGEISEATGKGKHTTTTAYLYPLITGSGYIIDSPGVREFGLMKITAAEVLEGFIEFRPFIGHCKFRNCAHKNEPGCALLEALETGKIDPQRWQSYQRILASLEDSRY